MAQEFIRHRFGLSGWLQKATKAAYDARMLREIKWNMFLPLSREKARLESELKRAQDALHAQSAQVRQLQAARKKLGERLSRLRASRNEAQEQLGKLRASRKKLRREIDTLKKNKDVEKLRKALRGLFRDSTVDLTAPQQVSLLYWLRDSNELIKHDLDALLSSLFAHREIELAESIIADDSLGFEIVREYYRLRLLDYRADESTLHEAMPDVFGQGEQSFLRGRFLNLFLQRAIIAGALDDVQKVFTLDTEEFRQISRSTIMGLCRLFLANQNVDAAAQVLTRYVDPNRIDQALYFLEPLIELERAGALPAAFQAFYAQLRPVSSIAVLECLAAAYEGADDSDRRAFRKFIVEPLSALPRTERNLMDVRFVAQQRSALLDHIRSSLLDTKPLSLIRLGDGEAYPYPAPDVEGIRAAVFERDDGDHERHWWGGAPPSETRKYIITGVRQAVARCDVLGIPSVYRIIRDFPGLGQRYGKNRSHRGFIRLLSALGRSIPVEDKVLTEERCHRCAIDEPFLIELAALARSVVVVSCWPELQFKFSSAPVTSIVIPPQHNLKSRASADDLPPLFAIYPDIIERIRAASTPGVLVLVGAGIIGKIFVDEARDCGAVALDVGSLLDYMAGVKTRSVGDVI